MSIKVMNAVWDSADCSGSELLILLALADFCDDYGQNAYPSMTTLGQKARLSESQARRVVQSLVKKELVEIVEAGGWNHGRNTSNLYRIRLETLNARWGSNLTPPPSRSRAHRGGTDAPTVVAPTRDDPSSDPLLKPPAREKRPPRAQGKNPYRPDEFSDIILG